MRRRIIQITAMPGGKIPRGFMLEAVWNPGLVALCDDGTLWLMLIDKTSEEEPFEWKPLPEIPQP